MSATDIPTVRPRLDAAVERRRTPDGRLVLVGQTRTAYMDVRPDEEALLALLDGARDLDGVVAGGLKLQPSVRPLQTLEFLRRLSRQGLLDGLGEAEEHLFGHARGGPMRMAARIADFRLHLAPLRALVEPGRLIPQGVWAMLHMLGLGLVASALVTALWLGRVHLLLDPFHGFSQPFRELAVLYLGLAGILSFRGLYRGLLLRSLGLTVPRAGVHVLGGVVAFDVDDRERRAASRERRLSIALGGLSALALVAGFSAWGYILNLHWSLRFVAPTAMVVLLASLAPYLHTDLAEVVAIRLRISQLRHRSFSYVLHRAGRNLLRRTPLGGQERRYLLVAFLGVLHGALSVHVLAAHLVPGALDVAALIIAGEGAHVGAPSGVLVAIGLLLAGFLIIGLAVLVGGLVILAMAVVVQLARRPPPVLPGLEQDPSPEHRAAFATHARQLPFFAAMGEPGLTALVSSMREEIFSTRQTVVRQGDAADRFYFIERGRCAVQMEEVSGRQHRVAELGTGDFFGEVALVRDEQRTATIVALEQTELLSLHRDTFHRVLAELDVDDDEVLAQLRHASFLRQVPALSLLAGDSMCQLLGTLEVLRVRRGEAIVAQGDEADAMFIVREGTLAVERDMSDGSGLLQLSTLQPTHIFGEMALMLHAQRNVTVRAVTDAVVLRVPADTFRAVLMTSFASAVTLDHGCAARLDALQKA